MAHLEHTMTHLDFPWRRLDVAASLEPLTDVDRHALWSAHPSKIFAVRDCVNVLDDMMLLTHPEAFVGAVIFPDEATLFEELGDVMNPIMDDLKPPLGEGFLSGVPDAAWVAHPLWPEVVLRATRLLALIRANGVPDRRTQQP